MVDDQPSMVDDQRSTINHQRSTINDRRSIVNQGNRMAKGDDIQRRLIAFGVAVMHLCSSLPKTPEANHISSQLLRCGTSVAPNYGEARGAESKKDFVHKLGVVLKELNEAGIWLDMLCQSSIASGQALDSMRSECTQLARIIVASIKTASTPRGMGNDQQSTINDRR
jgi:four helix bundle protein